MTSMLRAMGLRLAVQPIGKSGSLHNDPKYMGTFADCRSARRCCRRITGHRHSRTACRGSTGVDLSVQGFDVDGVSFENP